MRYTLLEQDVLESEFPRCEERGVGIVIGGGYNSGILATGAVPGAMYNYAPAGPDTRAGQENRGGLRPPRCSACRSGAAVPARPSDRRLDHSGPFRAPRSNGTWPVSRFHPHPPLGRAQAREAHSRRRAHPCLSRAFAGLRQIANPPSFPSMANGGAMLFPGGKRMFQCAPDDRQAPRSAGCLCHTSGFARLNARLEQKFSGHSSIAGIGATFGAFAAGPGGSLARAATAPSAPIVFTNVRLFDGSRTRLSRAYGLWSTARRSRRSSRQKPRSTLAPASSIAAAEF